MKKTLLSLMLFISLFSVHAMGRGNREIKVRNVGQTAFSVQWEFNYDSNEYYDTEFKWWSSEGWQQNVGMGKVQDILDMHDYRPEKNYAVLEPGSEIDLASFYPNTGFGAVLIKNPDAIPAMEQIKSIFKTLVITCADGTVFDLDSLDDSMFTRNSKDKLELLLDIDSPPPDKIFSSVPLATQTEKDVLIPYEINGKIGFVNQRLEKITEAKYQTLSDISKYCAVVFTDEYDYEVVTSLGTVLASDNRPYLIGDEHYTFYEQMPLPKVAYNRNDIHWRKNTIRSAFSPDTIDLYDLELLGGSSLSRILCRNPYNKQEAWLNYVSSDGEYLFPHENTFAALQDFDEKLSRAVVLDEDLTPRIVDETGSTVGTEKWRWLGPISGELIPGVKAETGESGYYDKDGKLVIPAEFAVKDILYMGSSSSFDDGIIPCRIIDGTVHIGFIEAGRVTPDWAIMDTRGNILVSNIAATSVSEFSDGVAVFGYYGGNQRYHCLLRSDGTILLQEQFNVIHDSVNGYCRARKDRIDYLIRSSDGAVFCCDQLFSSKNAAVEKK